MLHPARRKTPRIIKEGVAEDRACAAREWLSYVRDEQPELAPELGDQERYVPLLDAPIFSWFKTFRFAE